MVFGRLSFLLVVAGLVGCLGPPIPSNTGESHGETVHAPVPAENPSAKDPSGGSFSLDDATAKCKF